MSIPVVYDKTILTHHLPLQRPFSDYCESWTTMTAPGAVFPQQLGRPSTAYT